METASSSLRVCVHSNQGAECGMYRHTRARFDLANLKSYSSEAARAWVAARAARTCLGPWVGTYEASPSCLPCCCDFIASRSKPAEVCLRTLQSCL